MIFKNNYIFYNFIEFTKISIHSIFFIFIFQFFAFPALAETIINSSKEANLVVKKNGRVFLINQSTKKDKFFNLTKPNNKIELSKNETSILQNYINRASLATTRNDQIGNFVKNTKPFELGFNQKNFILRVINDIGE